MVISLEQRQVYSEVLEVLRHMDKLYVDKIPKKLIMFFYDNCSLDYEFRMTKSIGEENLWVFDILAENGITTDSSIFPSKRDFGGFPSLKHDLIRYSKPRR